MAFVALQYRMMSTRIDSFSHRGNITYFQTLFSLRKADCVTRWLHDKEVKIPWKLNEGMKCKVSAANDKWTITSYQHSRNSWTAATSTLFPLKVAFTSSSYCIACHFFSSFVFGRNICNIRVSCSLACEYTDTRATVAGSHIVAHRW